jgi:glucose-6-phosphate isomerase
LSDLLDVEAAAGLAVYGAAAVPGGTRVRADLTSDGVPALLAAKDPTLWGDAAEPEAKIRLGWLDTFQRSRALVPELARLRAELHDRGLTHVVLAGMGGSSLAPEVITRTLGADLTILDTTDPQQVRTALDDRIDRTVVVIASKSGSTVETDSHRRAYTQAFADAGLTGLGRRFVLVTDPGSVLESIGGQIGAHVILADAEVGGRYSALTAFGLVPAALAGVDVAELLDQAESFAASLHASTDNPALALGAALGAAALAGRDKVALIEDGTGIVGIADWIEQLLAESTGKEGTGILPVVVETPASPGATAPDVLAVTVGGSLPPGAVPGSGITPDLAVNGPLGAQFLAWEYATAIAGRILKINPFDQPNVAESKDNTNAILHTGTPTGMPAFVDGAIEVYGESLPEVSTVDAILTWLLGTIDGRGYLAVTAFLDALGEAEVAAVRPMLAARTVHPVTFGWGPRYLHSTGQFHKGGPQVGSFLQITGAIGDDLEVAGKPYSFGQLQAAQAAGDRKALAGRGRPLVHLHFTDRVAGITQLLTAAGETQEAA